MTTHTKPPTFRLPAFSIYAAPVALLIMASAMAMPTASADASHRDQRTVQAEFRYNADAPADQIYAKLRRVAQRMCTNPGAGPRSYHRLDRACMARAMEDGVKQIGRVDLAALHARNAG